MNYAIHTITSELNNISTTIQMTEKKSEVLSCTGDALVLVFCLRSGRLELRRGNRYESNIFHGISWWKWMKEVSGGGNTRNVLHFQWLLKVQRKKGFLLEILVNRAKEICNRVNIMQFGITAYCHLGEAKKSQRCFSFKATCQYILGPEQKERYDQNSCA